MTRKAGLCHRVDLVKRMNVNLGGPGELLLRNPVALCTGQRCSKTRVYLDISEDVWAVLCRSIGLADYRPFDSSRPPTLGVG